MRIHIHQGGTLRSYCGAPLRLLPLFVGWEDAPKATCPDCSAHFEHEMAVAR